MRRIPDNDDFGEALAFGPFGRVYLLDRRTQHIGIAIDLLFGLTLGTAGICTRLQAISIFEFCLAVVVAFLARIAIIKTIFRIRGIRSECRPWPDKINLYFRYFSRSLILGILMTVTAGGAFATSLLVFLLITSHKWDEFGIIVVAGLLALTATFLILFLAVKRVPFRDTSQ